MKTESEIILLLKAGAVLIANEDKLTAHIHENGMLKEKIKYTDYLNLYHLDVLTLKTVSSDTHIFTYTMQ